MRDTESVTTVPAQSPPSISAIIRNTVRILALILGACAFVGEVATIIYMFHGAPGAAELGAQFQRTIGPGQQHDTVIKIDPGSPLLAAGIHKGDAIRFDSAMDDGFSGRRFAYGEHIGLTVLDPTPRHVIVTANIPHHETPEFIQLIILDCATSMLSITLGALIMLRARGSNAMVALGLGFIVFASFSTLIPQNQTPTAFFIYSLGFGTTQGFVATLALLYFSIGFYSESNGSVARWVWPAFWLYAAVFVLITFAWSLLNLGNYALPYMEHSDALSVAWTELGFAAAFVGLVIGWRRARLELQKRYAVMTVAVALVIVCDVMFAWSFNAAGGFGTPRFQLWYTTAEWLSAAGHLLFAYAVLRDKVIDLGFVVNRAVVYGIISGLLLVAFGLIEWGAEKIIPESWLEAGKAWKDVLDALIALGVYLVFHRVRDTVERFIERLFFHKWHSNEEMLRRFVREADYITEPHALLSAFAAEITRFTHGATVQTVLRGDGGSFSAGDLVFDANDPALVALRARRSAVEPGADSSVHAALLLPFTHRGDLFGCLLIGQSPDGVSYRPDEVEVMTWAAHQIGLDYHALRVEALEREASALREQNAALSGVIGKALTATQPA